MGFGQVIQTCQLMLQPVFGHQPVWFDPPVHRDIVQRMHAKSRAKHDAELQSPLVAPPFLYGE